MGANTPVDVPGLSHLLLVSGRDRGPVFRWARLDVAAVHDTAARAGLVVREVFRSGRRWFAELARPAA
ncbi:hypothetical protein [Micromonospora sp. KC213]|uniref:hypothetical protein n=1 Tax=Micromonospora sp. KC213 TaxID=2530378 RepID=UPI001A9D2FA5|nr:hypothetical protein [Micromonospora sp. KC213]